MDKKIVKEIDSVCVRERERERERERLCLYSLLH